MEKSKGVRKNNNDNIMSKLIIKNLKYGDRLAVIINNIREIKPGDYVENVPRNMEMIVNEKIQFSDDMHFDVKGYENEDITIRVRNAINGRITEVTQVHLPAEIEIRRLEEGELTWQKLEAH